MPDLPLVLNVDLFDPTDRRMAAIDDLSTIGLPDFLLGETYSAALYLVDGTGAYRPESGNAGYAPTLGIGAPGSPDVVEVAANAFTPIANGWSFSLALTSAALLALFTANATGIQTLQLEFQTADNAGNTRKWYSRAVRIQPRVVQTGVPGPDPSPAYLTAAQIAALYPPLTQPNSGYRFKPDGAGGLIFQLFDTATNQFRTVWLVNGALQSGPPEN